LPAAPGAVLLALGVDAPRLVLADDPVARTAKARATGEARADGVEEGLRQRLDLRAVHAEAPDALERRIVGGELLGGTRNGAQECQGAGDGKCAERCHGVGSRNTKAGLSFHTSTPGGRYPFEIGAP